MTALALDLHKTTQIPPRRAPLGQVLIDMGALSPDELAQALSLQCHGEARLGDVFLAHGLVGPNTLCHAIARQFGTHIADLRHDPPDVRLVDELGVEFCLRHAILPWKRVGGTTVLVCVRPDRFEDLAPRLPASFGRARLAVAPEADVQRALVALRHRHLTQRAETRVAVDLSCRTWSGTAAGRIGFAALAVALTLYLLSPVIAFAVLTIWAVAALVTNAALRLAALYIHLLRPRPHPRPVPSRPGPLPVVSVLVPLFREREIAARLVARLTALDYPKELLDICLVVEEDDALTQATIAQSDLPPWMRQIVVPRGAVRTKPRAMNYALDFCRGSVIGIYDAEDAPDPDQIGKVAARFASAGPWVACLQGRLDFYNPRTNWLSRCFTIDYASWFRIVLPGMERIGFAIPLGGTTVFFRRAALEALGGWDAHNVTEDADLGIRLARRGYRTEMLDTVTKEEANCRYWPWIKQRSRWIKGYAMTYGVHMRQPLKLLTDLGPWRFLGFQAVFLGSLSHVLLTPLLWSFWAVMLGLPHPLADAMPPNLFLVLVTCFVGSEIINLAVGMAGVKHGGRGYLIAWVPTMHLYFPLATIAALKGFAELLNRPFYWDKTQHGHAEETPELV